MTGDESAKRRGVRIRTAVFGSPKISVDHRDGFTVLRFTAGEDGDQEIAFYVDAGDEYALTEGLRDALAAFESFEDFSE